MGYILKTHFPVGVPSGATSDARLLAILEQAVVVTVRRNHADVARSMARWEGANDGGSAQYDTEYDAFWGFWQTRPQTEIAFEDLFVPDHMTALLDTICQQTGTQRSDPFLGPPDASKPRRIYANKALTRLAGRHARRIDTTIHTLKR